MDVHGSVVQDQRGQRPRAGQAHANRQPQARTQPAAEPAQAVHQALPHPQGKDEHGRDQVRGRIACIVPHRIHHVEQPTQPGRRCQGQPTVPTPEHVQAHQTQRHPGRPKAPDQMPHHGQQSARHGSPGQGEYVAPIERARHNPPPTGERRGVAPRDSAPTSAQRQVGVYTEAQASAEQRAQRPAYLPPPPPPLLQCGRLP